MVNRRKVFVQRFSDLLRSGRRTGVERLELSDNGNLVTICFEGGGRREGSHRVLDDPYHRALMIIFIRPRTVLSCAYRAEVTSSWLLPVLALVVPSSLQIIFLILA